MDITKELGLHKFKLFCNGVNVDDKTLMCLRTNGYRVPSIVRTGASNGVETIVNGKLCVNIPINKLSPIHISETFDALVINDKRICSLEILKQPVSVSLEKEGKQFHDAGKICFDRLGITLYTGCCFKEKGNGCRFCGIKETPFFQDRCLMNIDDVTMVIQKAISCSNNQIKHILLSGGTLPGEEYGAGTFADATRIIKSICEKMSVYVMIPPPKNDSTLKMLIDSGVDEIGLNIEIMDKDYRKRLIPAKEKIGLKRYFSALEYLSNHLPKFGARSILIGGIEPIASTLLGIEELCKRGVMPIISHYRAIGNRLPSFIEGAENMYDLWQAATDIADKYGLVIGPTCIPCQNNVIALPIGDAFRYY